jgi:anaerobic selenocysteine-containing dehydrogenase
VPDPTVDIHPQTAQELGIKQGDWVRVESRRGSASMRANLTQGIHPKVVATVHGWAGKSNDNLLTNNKVCATAIGSTPLRGLLAKVYKET